MTGFLGVGDSFHLTTQCSTLRILPVANQCVYTRTRMLLAHRGTFVGYNHMWRSVPRLQIAAGV